MPLPQRKVVILQIVMKKAVLFLLFFCLCGVVRAQLPMNIVLMGDSNTFLGGDACDKPLGWNKWFKDLASPLSCRSYARSGATWTHTAKTNYDIEEYTEVLSDNNVIFNQINRLKEACKVGTQVVPDLIVIMAGTNDLWFADKRPDVLSVWIQHDCECLREAFPQAHVVLVTPPPFVKVGMDKQHRAADEIAACAERLHVGVVRLDQPDLNFCVADMIEKGYSVDGVHTTAVGAEVLGRYIYEKVKAIVQQ